MSRKLVIFDELIEIIQKEIDKNEKEINKIEDKNIKKQSKLYFISFLTKEIKKLKKDISSIQEMKKDLKKYYKLKKKTKP